MTTKKLTPCNVTIALAMVALFSCVITVHADDAPAPASAPAPAPPEIKKWDAAATVGITLTRGNSKTFLGTLGFNAKRSWTNNEVLLGANGGYGENTTTVAGKEVDNTTDSYIKGFAQGNHLFTKQTYAGLRIGGEHDDIAHLNYRFLISPLIGYYFIKETNSFFAGEIGPSYVLEKFFAQELDDYISLRVSERGEHKFKTGARIWESVEWLPKVEDFQNYLVNAELGVAAPISKALSLSLMIQDSYKSVPAPGRLRNDFKFIAGLTYNF
jgi:hypothetical protein